MYGGKPQSWKITVDARTKKFQFKFKASKTEPRWSFLRFAILIKIRKFLLNVKAESGTPITQQKPKAYKSKFRRFFQKFSTPQAEKRIISGKKTPNSNHPESQFPAERIRRLLPRKEPLCVGSLLIGTTLVLMSESLSAKDQKGIIVHGLSIFFLFVALLFERYMNGKSRSLLVVLTIATVVCAAVFCLDKLMNRTSGVYISELVWKAWNCATSSGCLYAFSQVVPHTSRLS
uniref:Uncharacterized protein MANES_08G171400 n=1 Tax=Rhizophora mucronata TaxID=61149 RepID=A0A2P2INY5_RHIMU